MGDENLERIDPRARAQAGQLRRGATPAEKRLWKHLRARRLSRFKFRRQQPIGRFVVDFFCPAAKLIVEIDGDSHADDADRDVSRTRWLETRGYRVIRFVNADVHHRLDLVLEAILHECHKHDSPSP